MTADRSAQGEKNRLLGKWGEEIVAADLRKKGWRILVAGYRCRFGEIDLIATDGKFLSFIEVKLRRDTVHGTAAEAVNRRKQERIRATAQLYLAQHPFEFQPRFDVAEVYAPLGFETFSPSVSYIENAF